MRSKYSLPIVVIMIVSFTLMCSCSGDDKAQTKKTGEAKQIIMADEGFYGWNALTLRSAFARIDVVPDLGGKIMGYEVRGFQILWHDAQREGELYSNEGYGYGQSFFNPGGAKVWPAPQGWSGSGTWPGPPDNVLDGSPYTYESDASKITVISPEDTGEGRSGLQFKHTYSLINSSSVVDLKLSMTNVVNRQLKWSLWHLATVPVDRPVTVYVPVNKGDWHVIFGDEKNPQWLDVENGLFRARYDKQVGKVGMKAREGWAAWHDEQNNMVFALLFPVTRGAQYPDDGSNFEIWTNGSGTYTANNQQIKSEYSPDTASMELEVLGPLTALSPGSSATLDVKWGACNCSGVVSVKSHGVVAQNPVINNGFIEAKFGVFYGGFLQEVYLDKNGKQKGFKNVMEVSPLGEVIIHQELEKYSSFCEGVRYQLKPYGQESSGVLGEILF